MLSKLFSPKKFFASFIVICILLGQNLPASQSLSPKSSSECNLHINGIELLTEVELDGEIIGLQWSPNGQTLAVNARNYYENWTIIQFFTFSPEGNLSPHDFQIENAKLVQFYDNNTVVAIVGGTLEIWDIADQSLMESFILIEDYPTVRWGPYGYAANSTTHLLAAIDTYPMIQVWDIPSGDLAFSWDGRLNGMNIGNQSLVQDGLAINASGDTIAFADAQDETVYFWNMMDPPQIFRGDGGGIHEIEFNHSGTLLAISGFNYGFRLVDTTTYREVAFLETISTFNSATTEIEFSQDDCLLIGADRDGQMEIWDIESEISVLSIQAHFGMIGALSVHPVDWILASGGLDGSLKVWHLDISSE